MSISDTPTPRPWRHETSFTHSSGRVLLDGNGYLFASFDDAGNAAHAVRCVNAHDDLLAACEAIFEWDKAEKEPYSDEVLQRRVALCADAFAKAKAAIAKARGQ